MRILGEVCFKAFWVLHEECMKNRGNWVFTTHLWAPLFQHPAFLLMQIIAAKPQLDEDFSEDDFLSSACSSRRESFSSLDNISTGSGSSSHRMQHRRRSSTSDASKFREKLHMLGHSVEMQEHLVTESPREGEQEEEEEEEEGEGEEEEEEGEGSPGNREEEEGEEEEEDEEVLMIKLVAGNGSAKQNKSNCNSNNNRDGTQQHDGTHTGGRQAVLNLAVANARKSTGSDLVAASVVNVGFDL